MTYDEMWEFQIGLDGGTAGTSAVASTGQWAQWVPASGDVTPPSMWDGQAVLVPSSRPDAMPSIWLIGGAQDYDGSERLVSMSNVWVYTPTNELGHGSWDVVPIKGTAPSGRKGHVAVHVGAGKIWIQGGRSMDESGVMADSAVLDTVKQRWSSTTDGPAVWGHSAVVLGDTVLMAFGEKQAADRTSALAETVVHSGYGLRAPALPDLIVYAPGNDTYLDVYFPSYDPIVSNPKSGQSTSASGAQSSPTIAVDPPVYPSKSEYTNGQAATLAPFSSAAILPPASPVTKASSTQVRPWVAPGGPTQTSLSGGSDSLNDNADKGSSSSSPGAQVVAGAVVGSILGALAVVAAGILVARRTRSRRRYAPYDGAWARWKGFERGDGGEDGKNSLVGGLKYDQDDDAVSVIEKPLPADPGRSSVGVAAALGGLWSAAIKPRKRGSFGRVAKDEEDVDWDRRRGWTTFADESEKDNDPFQDGETIRGRGGRGVWQGYDFGSPSKAAGHGQKYSDTVRSSTSFLGSALGGFAVVSSRDQDEDDRSLALSRIDEEAASLDGERYGSASTIGTTTAEAASDDTKTLSRDGSSSGQHTAPARPFSPGTTSLYGSTFHSPGLLSFGNRKTSRSSSMGSDNVKRSNSSWWGKLSRKSTVEMSTATARVAIRDPTPAPNLDVVTEVDSPAGAAAVDPFADPARHRAKPDEQGRLDPSVVVGTRRTENVSVSSRASSEATATSSVLEERMRNMDVVQRVRTASGSTTSVELTPTLGSTGGFGRLPEADESAESLGWSASPIKSPRDGKVRLVLTGDEARNPFKERPGSPAKRLVGPRTPGVRGMVEEIEQRQPSPMSRSGSFVLPSEPTSPTKAVTKDCGARKPVPNLVADADKRAKVAHGLVRKPVLYVANPDHERSEDGHF